MSVRLFSVALGAMLTASGLPALAAEPVQPTAQETAPAVEMVLEPKAIDILKAASSRLAAARTMQFTATISYESPSKLGPPLVFMTNSEVTLQRPDKLRVITPGDGPATEFYYDGSAMMALAPAENLVAVAEAPPTIDAALEFAYKTAAIYFPFTDLIVADPYAGIADGMKLAFYIGQSNVVGGTTTDMIAFADDDVFVQVWIGAEDKLPRMMRAVYRNDPLQLRHQLEITNWKLDACIAPETFASAKASAATPITFEHPSPKPSPEAKPPAQGTPAKSQ
jgi:hypothetical protein